MIAATQTWRANPERIARSEYSGMPVNRDCTQFLLELRTEYGSDASPIVVGGTIGPKGDGYLPEESPSFDEAKRFHHEQIHDLAESGVDFLFAKTLPAFDEARGIAHCMAETEIPYVLSFVVRKNGTLLDGTPMEEAIERIDGETNRPPANYNVNCVHASVFAAAMIATRSRNPNAAARICGLDANTSTKTPEELDGLAELDTEAPTDFGNNVWPLNAEFGTVYIGGCCGSSTEHMEALARCSCSVGADANTISDEHQTRVSVRQIVRKVPCVDICTHYQTVCSGEKSRCHGN